MKKRLPTNSSLWICTGNSIQQRVFPELNPFFWFSGESDMWTGNENNIKIAKLLPDFLICVCRGLRWPHLFTFSFKVSQVEKNQSFPVFHSSLTEPGLIYFFWARYIWKNTRRSLFPFHLYRLDPPSDILMSSTCFFVIVTPYQSCQIYHRVTGSLFYPWLAPIVLSC